MNANFESLINHPVCQTLFMVLGSNAELHLVGGIVRDHLLSKPAKDFDFAVKFPPEKVLEILEAAGIQCIETGMRRGTITALVKLGTGNWEPAELTTFRDYNNENSYSDCIEEDLKSRDFTINAIAVSLNDGSMIDPFGGIEDLKNGLVRAVGNPNSRFTEDPHRILRMIRFGFAQGRSIELETSLQAAVLSPLLKNVSIERISVEFVKILCCERAGEALKVMADLKILQQFIPEIEPCIGFEQNKWHKHDVFNHICAVVENAKPDRIVRLAAFFHDIAKPLTLSIDDNGRHFLKHEDVGAEMCETIMRRMKFSNDDIASVKLLVAEHMRSTEMGPKGMRRLIKQMGELLPEWLELKMADAKGGHTIEDTSHIVKFHEAILYEKNRKDVPEFSNLAIGGAEILALGLKPGPKVGMLLKMCEDFVLEEPARNVPEVLIEFVKGSLASEA